MRYEQKKAKYGPTADRYNLQFVPAVFSHTGQIHDPFKSFVMEQIRHKLIAFEGKARTGHQSCFQLLLAVAGRWKWKWKDQNKIE